MANCKDCIHYGVCTFHITGNENEKCPHYTTTDDVVPKSEVERLRAELDDKQFRCDSCDRIMLTGSEHRACIKQAKAEVAREIFEEIEKILKSSQTELIGEKFYYRVIVDKGISEFKKKYAEEKS